MIGDIIIRQDGKYEEYCIELGYSHEQVVDEVMWKATDLITMNNPIAIDTDIMLEQGLSICKCKKNQFDREYYERSLRLILDKPLNEDDIIYFNQKEKIRKLGENVKGYILQNQILGLSPYIEKEQLKETVNNMVDYYCDKYKLAKQPKIGQLYVSRYSLVAYIGSTQAVKVAFISNIEDLEMIVRTLHNKSNLEQITRKVKDDLRHNTVEFIWNLREIGEEICLEI